MSVYETLFIFISETSFMLTDDVVILILLYLN